MTHLIEFFGQECPHCEHMKPLVEQLEKELNLQVEKLETWHNEENAKKQLEYDKGLCGGVPFFYNTKSKKFLCGATEYQDLKKWAQSE